MSAAAVRQEVLQRRAVELRRAGLTFKEIGRVLGVSRQRAHQLYKEATKP